ncbi:MAG TPA: glutamate synthase (NADPH), homotetrameric [Candidatus Omnitrophica bacterium]|nr:MAG: glutamate synthase (NADPH), homotetrameric [Omnitrophica WOR_2 bacterium GWA2_63_20]OGX17445.1 MAG: glutamate synthase (NADPH), homotetrameric [Omnitrophica WOR_2 bacterium GWF2_63_9]OGX34799.1 MAG: glutamate synthase (NADPH), homotetrameric [Omnitrophica WOR_2 bacterium RIFCSPHIGHO2_02_FULL_63_39]OGX45788.1 MAG: glutamate synthase (NADPH), homotetrameric [Omnitrophica WOR_2 bacterium RIFCSPLOWO2_02_FULL_63_16]OGX49370.1 MAG: glutamate synthase (NADPH), homotetrameric [Omnitrophica WOR_
MPLKPDHKTVMPHQAADERAHTFDEVNTGYTEARAQFEASRCLQCQEAVCEGGCPVRVPIKAFLRCVAEGRFQEAFDVVKKANPLPAICGRVCPQETQCEKLCHMAARFEPVGIGHLERFVSDWERAHRLPRPTAPLRPVRPRVAIVGSGPSGLTAAGELARLGYRVTIFEALHEPGGVLRYGIPEFRLPKAILDDEIAQLQASGVEIVCNVVIGKTVPLDQLLNTMGYHAVFIGTGAGLPRFLGIPGENLNGVYSANEFLTRINLMKAYQFPESHTPLKVGSRVAVVGAGNTAMDAARSALRMGAHEVRIVYRRSEAEMSARVEEYAHAKEEGIIFQWLTNPIRVVGNDDGWVAGLECQPQRLGEPDESGRARPIPTDDPPVLIPIDTMVIAIGTRPNRLLTKGGDLQTTSWGGLIVNEDTGETSQPGVFAGGDAVTGAATVILAAGAGLRAASAIHARLSAAPGESNGGESSHARG